MRQTLAAFIGGVILGAGLVLTAGYMAGFERPVHQAVPAVAVAQPEPIGDSGWKDFIAVESRIPKHLQQCVSIRYAAQSRRHTETWQRELTRALERAVGECVALQKPPRTVAQK